MSAMPRADGTTNAGPIDRPMPVTFFKSFAADEKVAEHYTARALATRIRTVTAPAKAKLPWLKLATFGDIRTDKRSLRHDANVLAISGIEADYDGEEMTFDQAVELLEKRGIASVVYTSPSHTEDTPRWRVLCPLSAELPPERRAPLLGRLNGLFGGIFSGESWTISQSYYYGSINHNPSHRVELIDGLPLDAHDDLDAGWIGKPNTTTKAAPNGERASGPIDEPTLLAEITSGASYHQASVRLLGRWARNGVPYMEARARVIAAFEAVFPPDRDARWKMRREDVDRCLEDIYGKEAAQKDQGNRQAPPHENHSKASTKPEPNDGTRGTVSSFTIINPADLHQQHVPVREWIIPEWLPVNHVTADYGDGGTGKTLLAQQLQTACATGIYWCGFTVLRCRTFGLYCEDDNAELHRRQHAINETFGLNYPQLSEMRWVSGLGQDCTLLTFTSDGRMQPTERYQWLEREVVAFGARLVVLDTAADLFAGNENDRHQVRAFIGLLNGLALKIGGAVLLNAHPSRSGLASGNLDGGSTAWSNSVRSRWSLARPEGDDGAQPDPNARILTRRKANYASAGDAIQLRWLKGVLVPQRMRTVAEQQTHRAGAEMVFLALLDHADAQGVRVSESSHAGNYAPKVFAKRPDAEGYTKREFETAMAALFAARQIRVEHYSRKGHDYSRIGRDQPAAEDAA